VYPTTVPHHHQSSDGEMRQSIERMKVAIQKDVQQANREHDTPRGEEAQWRRDLLNKLDDKFEELRNPHPTIFVSYTVSGKNWLEEIEGIAERRQITVITDSDVSGFVPEGFKDRFEKAVRAELGTEKSTHILSNIMQRIARCDGFLGFWSASFEGRTIAGSKDRQERDEEIRSGCFPGVWMPFELGVARAAAKPYRVLWDQRLHTAYTNKIFMEKINDSVKLDSASETLAIIERNLLRLCDEIQEIKKGRK
jgi:hypothetical protein